MNIEKMKRGIYRTELLPAHRELRPAPENLQKADGWLFAHDYECNCDPCVLVKLDSVTVLGWTWLQLRHLRLADRYRPGKRTRRSRRARLRDLASILRPIQCVPAAFWAEAPHGINYFHWFSDVLPTFQAFLEAGYSCSHLILPADAPESEYIYRKV